MEEKENLESEIDKEIKHIENLIYKIHSSTPNQMTIDILSRLVHKEYDREVTSKNESKLYSKNLNLVINKELKRLINSPKKPRNRLTELIEFRNTIIPIMQRKISDFKQG